MTSTPTRMATGIPELDAVLRGGLLRNRIHLIEGRPGTGTTTLGLRYLMHGVGQGDACLYITLSESAEELHSTATIHGWSLEGIRIVEVMPLPPERQPAQTVLLPTDRDWGELERHAEQLEAALLNIVGNARDAMPDGGLAFIRREQPGTTIGLLLPRSLAGAASPTPAPRHDTTDNLEGLHILCVEDDPAVIETTVALLESLGAGVVLAHSADAAIGMEPGRFDLVLSDVMMPGKLDGIRLAHWLGLHALTGPPAIAACRIRAQALPLFRPGRCDPSRTGAMPTDESVLNWPPP